MDDESLAITRLSPRERACLGGVAALLDSKTIARELGLSSKTVDNHIERACRKLKARNRRDAALTLAHTDPAAVWERFPKEALPIETTGFRAQSVAADAVEEQRTPFDFAAEPKRSKEKLHPLVLTLLILASVAAIAVIVVAIPQLGRGAQELADRIKSTR